MSNAHLNTQGGVLRGDVPPSEARKFSIFETGILMNTFGYKFEAGNE